MVQMFDPVRLCVSSMFARARKRTESVRLGVPPEDGLAHGDHNVDDRHFVVEQNPVDDLLG